MAVIQGLKDVKKYYTVGESEILALDVGLLNIYSGEMLAVMGTSGSGKSTLLNILGALDIPDEGEITLEEKQITSYYQEPYASKYRSDYISFVFQDYNLIEDLTVEDNLAVPLILKKESKTEIRNKVDEFAKLVGLENRLKHKPSELSGGQKQRVAIARALIDSPKIILADEPTGNLDYKMSKEIMKLFKDIQKRFNQTLVVVTHDAEVASYADRIIFLNDGKITGEIGKTDSVEEIMKAFIKSDLSRGGEHDQ